MRNLGERTALAVISVFLATLGATAGPVVKGDPKAYAEIKVAFVKLLHVKSYRAKATTQEMGSMTMEFVSPDRWHFVQKMGGVVGETIIVGKGSRVRQAGGPWQCLPEQEGPISLNLKDMEEIKGEVTAAKGPVVAIDGVQTQSYTYSTNENEKTRNQRLFVALTNGLPKRVQELDKQGAVKSSTDYFDYNAPITITLPPCK